MDMGRAPKGCPCTPQLLCEADERGIFTSTCQVSPGITYSMHGGAGAILSVGLLQIISLDFMESCISSLHSMGTGAEKSGAWPLAASLHGCSSQSLLRWMKRILQQTCKSLAVHLQL